MTDPRTVNVKVSGRIWMLLRVPRAAQVWILRTRIEGRTIRWSLHYESRWTARRDATIWSRR